MSTPITLGAPLCDGSTAEIFSWPGGRILKLFRTEIPSKITEQEVRVTRAVHGAGLPVPEVIEVVEVGGRQGIVYEQISGRSMNEIVSINPYILSRLGRELAQIQIRIHQLRIAELPRQRRQLALGIKVAKALSPALKAAALAALSSLPDDDVVCHSDLHLGNVLMGPQGGVVIDWQVTMAGNPLADIARSLLLLETRFCHAPFFGRWCAKVTSRLIRRAYVDEIHRLQPALSFGEVERWISVVAAARLGEKVAAEEHYLLQVVTASLPS